MKQLVEANTREGWPMLDSRSGEEISRTIQELNHQIENRQAILGKIRRERESQMCESDKQIKRESDEIARLEAQMVEMKTQLR